MTMVNVQQKPYLDLARAASWHLRRKGDERATAAFLEALRAIRVYEDEFAYRSTIAGLRVHLMGDPDIEGKITLLENDRQRDGIGYNPQFIADTEAAVLAAPNVLVWECSRVDIMLAGTHVPPSVRAFMEFFAGTVTIEEARIDQFFMAVGHLLRDQPQVKTAAMFLLSHVGQRARMISW
jgi:hypothetical protein